MNAITATFKTRKAAHAAYLAANLSPYTVILDRNVVTLGSRDTSEATLIGWFAMSVSSAPTFEVVA